MKRTGLRRTAMKRTRRKSAPPEIRAYWNKVAALGCIISGSHQSVTIHHVHGGSMRGILDRGRGMKNDWFVIPLAARYHTGDEGVDSGMGVDTWEARYGTQLEFIRRVMRATGVDPFAQCGIVPPTGC